MTASEADDAARNAAARTRLTPTERLHEVTMAAMTRQPSPPEHSVDLTRNAKGICQWTVTVRGHDLDAVLASAQATYETLTTAYPYPSENGSAES